MQRRIEQNIDNCISIDFGKFSLLQREYLLCAVIVLTTRPKVSDINKRDTIQLNFPKSNKRMIKVL